MTRQSVIKGAFILSVAGFGVRFIGLGLRVALNAFIGDEGLGLYGLAYPIYGTLLALSTAGIPVAISKLVSQYMTKKDYHGAYRVFRIALFFVTTSGLIVSIVMFFSAPYLALHIAKDPNAFYPIAAIAPAVFFTSVMACFRGFFQGQQQMIPTAISQIIEQFFRVGTALVLVVLLLPMGLEFAAAGATFGAVAGALAGLLFLLFLYFKDRTSHLSRTVPEITMGNPSNKEMLRNLLAISLPITLSHLVTPLQSLIDLFTVLIRLEHLGLGESRRLALYGQLTSMAGPIIHIPQILTVAIAVSLLPAISEASALNNNRLVRFRSSLALRLSIILGLPAAVGIYILATPITVLLFQNQEAGKPLAFISLAVLFIAMYQTSSAILQGLGKTHIPLINLIIGAGTKVFCNWFLVAIPALNINGAAIGSVIGFFVSSTLNLYRLRSLTGLKLDYNRTFIKPAFSGIFMGLAVYLSYTHTMAYLAEPAGSFSYGLSNALSTMGAVGVGVVSYGLALFILGALDKDDLLMIPRYGPLILKWTVKFRLLK